jgi:hypothetical protein
MKVGRKLRTIELVVLIVAILWVLLLLSQRI